MAILIVGGSGRLGQAVAARCERTDEVIQLARRGPVAGDVRRPGLCPAAPWSSRVRIVVSCFGSVDLQAEPAELIALHDGGMANLLAFCEGLPNLERVVHVSSLAVLGDHGERSITGAQLNVGQRFRTWYEYGKYLAESRLRRADVPWRVVRFGPLLPAAARPEDPLTQAVRVAVTGCPVPLVDHGAFPSFVSTVDQAAEVVEAAVSTPGNGEVWSFADPTGPSMADLLRALCRPWNVVPRIVPARRPQRLPRPLLRLVDVPPSLLAYASPLLNADPWELDGPPEERRPSPMTADAVERLAFSTHHAISGLSLEGVT